jgi:hypothetical protein
MPVNDFAAASRYRSSCSGNHPGLGFDAAAADVDDTGVCHAAQAAVNESKKRKKRKGRRRVARQFRRSERITGSSGLGVKGEGEGDSREEGKGKRIRARGG